MLFNMRQPKPGSMKRFTLTTVTVLVVSSPVLAWHDAGHKIIASIAFRQLAPAQQTALVTLLKEHPRYQDEFVDKIPEDLDRAFLNEWIVQQAAIFPDDANSYPEELRKKYYHLQWHFINSPEFLTEADRLALKPEADLNLSLTAPKVLDENSNVVQVIRVARRTLANKDTDVSERALLLSWLIHTVGDVHQPLHSTMLFSQELFPRGDRGGNRIITVQMGNLHAVWDDFPGGREKFQPLRNRSIALLADGALVELGKQAAQDLDEETWLKESRALATNLVYDSEVMAALRHLEATKGDIEKQPLDLSEDYLRAGAAAAEKRVVQAGFRLGAILSQLFE